MPFDLSQEVVANLEYKAYQIDSLGRRWNPALHPRDSKGRFIETGGIVRIGVAGGMGKVMRALMGNKVEVARKDGSRLTVDARQLTMVRRPNGAKPTADARKVVQEDAKRENDPTRGDGLNNDDDQALDGIPDDDPDDEDAQAENLDDAPEVPEAFIPSRDDAKEGDFIALAGKHPQDGKTVYALAEVTKTDGKGKATHVRLAGDNREIERSRLLGDGDGDAIIPREDLGDHEDFEDDAKRGPSDHPLTADEATDLLEVYAKPKESGAKGERDESGKPGAVRVSGDDLRQQSNAKGIADGSMYLKGTRVGRIYPDPDVPGREKFVVRGPEGFKKQVNSFDSGREVLARHLTKLANGGGKKQPAKKADAQTPAADAPEAPNAPEVAPKADTPSMREAREWLSKRPDWNDPEKLKQVAAMTKAKPSIRQAARDRLAELKNPAPEATPERTPDQGPPPEAIDAPEAPEVDPNAPTPTVGKWTTERDTDGSLVVTASNGTTTIGRIKRKNNGTYEGRMEGRRGANLGKTEQSVLDQMYDDPQLNGPGAAQRHRDQEAARNAAPEAPATAATPEPEPDPAPAPEPDATPDPATEAVARAWADINPAFAQGTHRPAKGEAPEGVQVWRTDAGGQHAYIALDDNGERLAYGKNRAMVAHDAGWDLERRNRRGAASDEAPADNDRVTVPADELPRVDDAPAARPETTPDTVDNESRDEGATSDREPERDAEREPEREPEPRREPVREPDPAVLDDVPAERGREDEPAGSGTVLREPGDRRGGSDRDSDGGEPERGEASGRQPADARPTRGNRGESGTRGSAGRPRVPAAGARDESANDADQSGPVAAAQRGVTGGAFRPSSQSDLAGGSGVDQKQRARENLAALQTLRKIQAEGREATADEQAVMAKWGGMGAIKPLFTKGGKDKEWAQLRDDIRALLPDDAAWEALKDNAANAHYTDYAIVDAMWGALERLGFERGNVLEPGSGLGNFIFRAPGGAKVHGVEVEPITAAISQLLSPNATIRNESFGQTRANQGTFDAAIGNVPFGNYRVYDGEFNPKLNKRIHDHFSEKALASVKPGGVMVMVTSAGTMDKGDRTVREAIYKHSDLIGMVRLPNGAHKDAAGTDVATDVMIFRKRKSGEKPGDDSWLGSSVALHSDGTPVVGSRADDDGNKKPQAMNDYYTVHPENVLGEIVDGGFNHIEVSGDFNPDDLTAALDNITDDARARGLDFSPEGPEDPELFREAAKRLEATTVEPVRPADGEGENLLRPPSEETIARRGNRLQGSIAHVGTWKRKGRGKTVNAGGTPAGKVKVTEEHQFAMVDATGSEVDYAPSQGERDELARLLRMRDLREDLIFLEKSDEDDTPQMDALRKELSDAYDEYVDLYGPIGRMKVGYRKMPADQAAKYQARLDAGEDPDPDIRPTADGFERVSKTYPGMGGMRNDPSFWALLSLEGEYEEGSPDDPADWGHATRGDILDRRQMRPYEPPQTADEPDDAVAIVEEKLGRIDLAEVARVLGIEGGEAAALAVLGDRVLKDHRTGEWVKYRSYIPKINLRETLRELQEKVQDDPSLQRNIDMITAVMPADKPIKDIQARLGAKWMPSETFLEFMQETVGGHQGRQIRLEAGKDDEGRNVWKIKGKEVGQASIIGGRYAPDDRTPEQRDPNSMEFTPIVAKWGTGRVTFQELVEFALNNAVPVVNDEGPPATPGGRPTKIYNPVESEAAKDMLTRVQNQFALWLRADPERASELERIYNDRFRSRVPANYINSPNRPLPGMNAAVVLDQHQVDGVTRGVEEDAMGAAWEVGVGKTFLAGALYAERKRLGKSKKIYHTTPNHLVEQTAREFKHLYPDMKILVVDGESMKTGPKEDKERIRRRTLSQMRDGDWDVVIASESADAQILPNIDDLIADREAELEKKRQQREKAEDDGNTEKMGQLTQQIKDLEAQIDRDRDQASSEDRLDFKALGFDYIGVDESHRYKNDLVLGGPPNFNSASQASKRARNLRAKIDGVRAFNRENGGDHGVLLLSGTPVTNNTREFFVNMRMLRPDLLEEAGVLDFDDFYSMFLESAEDIEGTVYGGTQLKVRDGFKLVNAGELVRMWQQAWDVVKAADVGIERPNLKNGAMENVSIPMTEHQGAYYEHLWQRYQDRPKKWKLDKGDDNALAIGNDGLMAAIDMRLLPDKELEAVGLRREDLTDDDGKIGPLADKVIASWNETKDRVYQTKKGVDRDGNRYPDHPNPGALQLIFSDVGVPGGNSASGFNLYDAIKNRLVADGMSPDEVAFIHDAADRATMKKLTDKARAGEIKVLIGSSAKMATGLNVQDRLTDIWHIDTQKTPDVVEQRNGRGIRRGNQNAEVNIGYVTTEGTSEAWAWSVASNKDNFLRQFDEADMDSTIVAAPEDNAAAPLTQLKATASKDPYMIEQHRAKKDLQELERANAIHQGQIESANATILRAGNKITGIEQTIRSFDTALEGFTPIEAGEKSNFLLRTADGSHSKLDAAAEALEKSVRANMVRQDWMDTTTWEPFATLGGQQLMMRRVQDWRGDKTIQVAIKDPNTYDRMLPGSTIGFDPTGKFESAQAVRLRTLVNKLPELRQGQVNARTDQENAVAQARETLESATFDRQVELDAARERMTALDRLARFDFEGGNTPGGGSMTPEQRQARKVALEDGYKDAKQRFKDLHDEWLEANGGIKTAAKLGAVKRSRRDSQQQAADRMNERIEESGVPLNKVPRKTRTLSDEEAAAKAEAAAVRAAKRRDRKPTASADTEPRVRVPATADGTPDLDATPEPVGDAVADEPGTPGVPETNLPDDAPDFEAPPTPDTTDDDTDTITVPRDELPTVDGAPADADAPAAGGGDDEPPADVPDAPAAADEPDDEGSVDQDLADIESDDRRDFAPDPWAEDEGADAPTSLGGIVRDLDTLRNEREWTDEDLRDRLETTLDRLRRTVGEQNPGTDDWRDQITAAANDLNRLADEVGTYEDAALGDAIRARVADVRALADAPGSDDDTVTVAPEDLPTVPPREAQVPDVPEDLDTSGPDPFVATDDDRTPSPAEEAAAANGGVEPTTPPREAPAPRPSTGGGNSGGEGGGRDTDTITAPPASPRPERDLPGERTDAEEAADAEDRPALTGSTATASELRAGDRIVWGSNGEFTVDSAETDDDGVVSLTLTPAGGGEPQKHRWAGDAQVLRAAQTPADDEDRGGLGGASSEGSTLADGTPVPDAMADEAPRDPKNYDDTGMGKVTRGQGFVSVDTILGDATISKGDDGLWFVTYPGQNSADDFFHTQKAALGALQGWMREHYGTPEERERIAQATSEADAAEAEYAAGLAAANVPGVSAQDILAASDTLGDRADSIVGEGGIAEATPEQIRALVAEAERLRTPEEQAALDNADVPGDDEEAGEEPSVPLIPNAPEAPVETTARVEEGYDSIPANYEPRTPTQLDDEKFPLNEYQQVMADDAVVDRADVVAAAKAGTGKTSTAVGIAKRFLLLHPKLVGGYLAFNKSVQVEAADRMPGNVQAMTGHAAPFQWVGGDFTDARFKKGLIELDAVADYLGIPNEDMDEVGDRARQTFLVQNAVSRFALSADDEVGRQHFSTPDGESLIDGVSPEDVDRLLGWANRSWADVSNRDGGRLYVNNDHIRKMWALARPDFSKPGWGFKKPLDFVFLDEAQDTPPVLAKVLADQHIQRIILGDSDQAIYGSFTGSVDYMKSITPAGDRPLRRRPLPKSYRYGPEIADAGNRPLQLAGSPERVIGAGGPGEVVPADTMTDAHAILVRSNAGLLTEALGVIDSIEEGDESKIIGVPKGTRTNLESLIETVRFLRDGGRRPKSIHEDFARYSTWKQFEDAAESGDDQRASMLQRLLEQRSLGELQGIVDNMTELRAPGDGIGEHLNLREIRFEATPDDKSRMWIKGDYKLSQALRDQGYRSTGDYLYRSGVRGVKFGEIPGGGTYSRGRKKGQPIVGFMFDKDKADLIAQKLRDFYDEPEPKDPDVVISTVHKAKGLEWDNVKIGSDFRQPRLVQDPETGEERWEFPSDEEHRIAYVAMTRAAKKLDPGSLAWYWEHTDENGGDPNAPRVAEAAPEDVTPEPETVTVAPGDLPTVDGPAVDTTPDLDADAGADVPDGAGADLPEGDVPDADSTDTDDDADTDNDDDGEPTGLEDVDDVDLEPSDDDSAEQGDRKRRERRRRRRRNRPNPNNDDSGNDLPDGGLLPDLPAPLAAAPSEGSGGGADDGDGAPERPRTEFPDRGRSIGSITVRPGDRVALGYTGQQIEVEDARFTRRNGHDMIELTGRDLATGEQVTVPTMATIDGNQPYPLRLLSRYTDSESGGLDFPRRDQGLTPEQDQAIADAYLVEGGAPAGTIDQIADEYGIPGFEVENAVRRHLDRESARLQAEFDARDAETPAADDVVTVAPEDLPTVDGPAVNEADTEAPISQLPQYRTTPTGANEALFAAETAAGSGRDPGFQVSGQNILVRDPDAAIHALEGIRDIHVDNAGDDSATARERQASRRRAEALTALIDAIRRDRDQNAPADAAPAADDAADAGPSVDLASVERTADDFGTMLLPAGTVARTVGGRETTPFPRTDFSNNRKGSNSRRRVDDWLLENAKAEADDRGLNNLLPNDAGNMTPAERDEAESILFDPALREFDGSANVGNLRPLIRDTDRPTPDTVDAPGVTDGADQADAPEAPAADATPDGDAAPVNAEDVTPDAAALAGRFPIPEPKRAGNGQITKSTAARALYDAAQVAEADNDRDALHLARRALVDPSWNTHGGPENQGASLANIDRRALEKIGATIEDMDARIGSAEDLARHLDDSRFGNTTLGNVKVSKSEGEEPTVSDYLRRYAAGYRAARAAQEPTAAPDTPENVDTTPDADVAPDVDTTPAVDATPDAVTPVTPTADPSLGAAATPEWTEDMGVWETTTPNGRAEVYPEGDEFEWAVHSPDGTTRLGRAATPEAARAAAEDALRGDDDTAATAPEPVDETPEPDVDADAPEPDAGGRDAADDEDNAAGDTADDDETAAPVLNGQSAAWVPTGSLEPGDTAQVSGDDGNGSATTRTGTVLGTPESVEVHEPGKPPTSGHLVTVGDRAGDGDRGTVLTEDESMAIRAERDEEAGDRDDPASVAESNIRGGQVGDSIPTDSNGLGLFPGSAVTDSRGRKGRVRETGDNEAQVRWEGNERDETVRPGLLTVDTNEHPRPWGWNRHGQKIATGQIVETEDGDRGTVENVDGDTAGVLTPNGMVYKGTGDLKVVGRVADSDSGKDDLRESPFDAPAAPEGMDIRPTDPVKPDPLPEGVTGATVNLKPDQLAALNDLGLDTDAITPYDVQQAAARVRHGLPVSTEQATALAAHLRGMADNGGIKGSQARALRRVANRLDAAAARGRGETPAPPEAPAGTPERTTVADVRPGDVIAVPDPVTGALEWGTVITKHPKVVREDGTVNPAVADTVVELANGDRVRLAMGQDTEVYRLPDMPDSDDAVNLPEPTVDEDRPFVEPRVAERVDDAAEAVVEAAVGGDETPDSLDELAAQAVEALDNGDDDNDQRNASERMETSLANSGLDEESAEAVHEAAEAIADEVADEVADVVLNTVADAEPLPGESDNDAAERIKDRIRREASLSVDRDDAVERAVDRANGDDEGAPTDEQKESARRETVDAMRADLGAMAELLGAQGDTISATALSEVAARLAGRPDPIHVERAVRALSMGRRPTRVAPIRARVMLAFQRARARLWERIKDLMVRAGRSLRAALNAARSEWHRDNDRDADDLVESTARDLAKRGRDTDLVPDEPQDFAERVAFWRDRLPDDPTSFGRVPGRRGFRGLTLDALRSGRQVRAENLDGTRLDRAADGGPGAKALGDLRAVSGLGGALDDEVHARVRSALPDLGDDPAATVREARRYAKSLGAEHRGEPGDTELADLRAKAKADADDKAKRYADALAESTLAVLSESREVGPRGDAKINVKGRAANAEEVQALRWAEKHLPTDWLTAAGTVEAQAGRMTGYRDDGTITVAPLGESNRDGAGEYGFSALHGLARHMEATIPGLREAAWAYHWQRTSAGAPGRRSRRGRNALGRLSNLFPGSGASRDQVARPGDYPAAFMGQETEGEHPAWWPIGVAALFTGDDRYLDDDIRKHLMGLMAYLERGR